MLNIGKFNLLEVIKKEEHGFYLEGGDHWGNILLPNKYVPEGLKVGDEINVFVYLDSKDIVIATTQRPYAMVGEFASLEVSSVEEMGVFLDWGLEKELFVPFREQIFEMLPGRKYVVYVYIDSSYRIAASTRINNYTSTEKPPFRDFQKVELLPYQVTDLGVNAIVEGTHKGLIYKEEIYNKMPLGVKLTGYIKKIRADNKIDLRLQPEGLGGREELAEQIIAKLKKSGGSLNITSKTPAATISSMFNVSRNKFKIALGYLYKNQQISLLDDGITLKK